VPSTAIALVRLHAEKMRAPRALWVPFELGRPLGAPNEPAFQRRVISAALELLVSDEGPVVLKDFPDDAPGPKSDETTSWVCPVSFPPPAGADEGLAAAAVREIDALAPWYQISLERRGRTSVGVSGRTPQDAARFAAAFLDDSTMPEETGSRAQDLKDACTDLMAYYTEAGTAQPGQRSSRDVQNWFWHATSVGSLLLDMRAKLLDSDDKRLQTVAGRIILPKSQGG